MKTFLFIGLFLFCSCTITIPKSVRVRNVVTRYLGSVNKGDKVEFLKFSDLLSFDGAYMAHQNQLAYQSDSNYKALSDSEKAAIRNKLDTIDKKIEGFEIFCTYSVKNIVHTDLFKIDTAFKKVKYVVEISKSRVK